MPSAGIRRWRTSRAWSPEGRRWLGFVALLLVYCVVVSVAVAQSVAAGHSPWARYLFPVVPVVVLGAVWGLHQLWASRWLLVAVVTMMFVVEAVVLVSLVPDHLLYPYIGMGAPGLSPVGRDLGRIVALIGAIVTVAAIAWQPRARVDAVDLR